MAGGPETLFLLTPATPPVRRPLKPPGPARRAQAPLPMPAPAGAATGQLCAGPRLPARSVWLGGVCFHSNRLLGL